MASGLAAAAEHVGSPRSRARPGLLSGNCCAVEQRCHEIVGVPAASAELAGDLADRLASEVDPFDAGEQQREGDGLGVAVGELVLVRVREQQFAQVGGQAG